MNAGEDRRSSTSQHYFGAESWQTRHDECLRLQREIATSLADRDRLPTTSHRYSNLHEQILQKLKILAKKVDALKQDLNLTKDKSLTSGERVRRQGLVDSLLRSEQELRFSMTQSSITKAQRKEEAQRKELLYSEGGGLADLGEVQWGASRTNQNISNYGSTLDPQGTGLDHDHPKERNRGSNNLMTNRQFDQILSEQDSGLDSLHSVIVRSRITAQNIESEVGVQNDIIDNLDDDLERTTQHLLSTTQRVRSVDRTSTGVWKYWLVISILFIVIVVIIAIP